MECFRSVLAPVTCDSSDVWCVEPLVFLQYTDALVPGIEMSFSESFETFLAAEEVA